MNLVGSAIKQLRDTNHVSTYDLAKLTGISQSTISKLENGKRNADIEILNKIAKALNVDVNEILQGPKTTRELFFSKLKADNITLENLISVTGLSKYDIEETFISIDFYDPNNLVSIGKALGYSKGFIEKNNAYDHLVFQTKGKDLLSKKILNLYNKWIETQQICEDEIKSMEDGIRHAEVLVDFFDPKKAIEFILKQPSMMAYGGYDLDNMTDEEILEVANDMLLALKISLERRKSKLDK